MQVFKSLSRFLLAVALLSLSVWLSLPLFEKINFSSIHGITILSSIFFIFFIFFISGVILRNLLLRNGCRIGWGTTLQLPYTMNLWGFIIPIQGSFIYFIALLKCKYKLGIVNISANYLWLFALELTIDGLIGLVFILFYNKVQILFPIFIIMTTNLFFVLAFRFMLIKLLPLSANPFVVSLSEKLNALANQIYSFSFSEYLKFGFFSFLITALSVCWSFILSQQLNLGIDLVGLVIVAVLTRIGLLIKLTPGNLGTIQLATGGIFTLLGYSIQDGIYLSIWQQGFILLVSIPIGILGTILDSKFLTFRQLISRARP